MQRMADRDTPFILNEWYVAALGSQLRRELLKRTLLDQRIVMYRTSAGAPVALEDRCAHRSFPLSAGALDGDTIVCGYHGLRYNAVGDCIEVPSQPTCPRGIGVRNFPLVEQGPFVWIWMGDAQHADPARIPSLPWLQSDQWRASQDYLYLPGNYVSLHENLLDLTHLSFVHAKTFGTPEYAKAPYEVKMEEGYYRLTRKVEPTQLPPVWAEPTGIRHKHAARVTTSEFLSPAVHVVTGTFYDGSVDAGQRKEFHIKTSHVPTPETHSSTHYFVVHSRDFALDDNAVTEFMREQLLAAFREDIAALTQLEDVLAHAGDRLFEISIAADAPSVAMRRYLKSRALLEAKQD